MAKLEQVRNRLIRRIEAGDYATRPIPAERILAVEFEVSYMTLRKAVNGLIAEGWLARQDNGRLEVDRRRVGALAGRQIALLLPAFSSPELANWSRAVDAVCTARGWRLRLLAFSHWEDPIIADTLSGTDGVFLLPLVEDEPPPLVIAQLTATAAPVVVLDQDWTRYGLPSIQRFPLRCIAHLVDLLAGLGHRRIDCFNVQGHDTVITERIAGWRAALAASGLAGECQDRAIASLEQPAPAAYDLAVSLLDQGWSPGAVICTTMPAAAALLRACHERGRMVPGDLSVAVVNGEGLAPLLVPSVTAIEEVDARGFLERCLDWMASGTAWRGNPLLRPREAVLAVRESTGPVRAAATIK